MPVAVCDSSKPSLVALEQMPYRVEPETEQGFSVAVEEMPFPVFLGMRQEMFPVTSEQMLLHTALKTGKELLSMGDRVGAVTYGVEVPAFEEVWQLKAVTHGISADPVTCGTSK